jgi:hypothetical protein
MSLLFTALFTRMQPNLQATSKVHVVDRKSNGDIRPRSVNEFHPVWWSQWRQKVDDDKLTPLFSPHHRREGCYAGDETPQHPKALQRASVLILVDLLQIL